MKKIFLLFMIVVFSAFNANAESIQLMEASLNFNMPDQWKYYGEDDSIPNKNVYIFKRDYIINSEGSKIIPAIIVINEKTVAEDSIVYFVNKKMEHKLKNTIKYYTWYDKATQLKQAVIFHAINYDEEYSKLSYNAILMTATYGTYGFYIYCNVTSEVYDDVKDEFFTILKSVVLDTRLPQDEIIQIEKIEKGKKYIQMFSNRNTSDKSKKKMGIIKEVIKLK